MPAVDQLTRPYAYAAVEESGQATIGHLDARCRDLKGRWWQQTDLDRDPWPCSRCVSLDQLDDWARRTPDAGAMGWARSSGEAAAKILEKTSPGTKDFGGVVRYTGCTATTDTTPEDTTMNTTTRSNDLTAELLDTLKNAFATAARYGVPGVEDFRQATLKVYRDGDLTAELVESIIDTYMAAAAVKAQVIADSKPEVTPAPAAAPEFVKGMIVTNAAGQIVRLYGRKADGKLYGKVRDEYGDWEYVPGAMSGIRHLTADEAAAYGHRHDACVFCATPLSDEREGRSVEVGYGPVCAAKYGLPWGTK